MTAPVPERIIPRPSERRREVDVRLDPRALKGVRLEDDLVITRDAPTASARTGSDSEQTDPKSGRFVALGWILALGGAALFGWLGLTGRADTTLGLLFAPLFMAIGHGAMRRYVAPRYGDVFVGVMIGGLGARLIAAVPRLLGGADSPIYQREGVRIARSLRVFEFGVDTGRAVPGTGAVRYFSGIVNVATGSTLIATYLVFVLLAFIGQVFLLIGLRGALTTRQFRLLTLLVAFSPTMIFWPSSIGKESLALLGIGLGVHGAARLYERNWSGLTTVLLGIFAVGMVRPHIALVLLVGVLIGLFARRAHSRGRLATHSLLLVVVLVGAMWVTNASANLFGVESLDGLADVSAALDFAQERTSQDTSRFEAARIESPLDYPFAAVTVLFRPFVWETDSAVALASAIEGAGLAVLVLFAAPGLLGQFRSVLQRGQLLMAVAFSGVFIFVFSAIGNFGILSRQRSQVVPFILLFIALGLAANRDRSRPVRQ